MILELMNGTKLDCKLAKKATVISDLPKFVDMKILQRAKNCLVIQNEMGLTREIHPSVLTDSGLDIELDAVHVPYQWSVSWFEELNRNIKVQKQAEQKQLFENNLAKLIQHQQFIFSDSRYFLAKVEAVTVGLAYAGAYRSIPIGVLLEIWSFYPATSNTCKCGGKAPIYSFGGSPLSGRHSASGLCIACGKKVNSTSGSFKAIWTPFYNARSRYNDYTDCESVSLAELIDIIDLLN